VAANIAIAD